MNLYSFTDKPFNDILDNPNDNGDIYSIEATHMKTGNVFNIPLTPILKEFFEREKEEYKQNTPNTPFGLSLQLEIKVFLKI